MQARHEPERRHVKYLLNVPLDDNPTYKIGNEYYSAETIRKNIIDTLTEPSPGLTDEQRTARAQKLRQMLETVVADPKSHKKIKKDKKVQGGYDAAQKMFDAYRKVDENTIKNSQGNTYASLQKMMKEQSEQRQSFLESFYSILQN